RAMNTIMNVIDAVIGTIGIPANFLLLVAILFSKDANLKAYSLILLNSALTDLMEVIVELLSISRMMADFPYLVYIFEGFCTHLSASVCQRSMQIELHLIFHSIPLIAVSFWYRNTALSGRLPSFVHVQSVIFAILLPTVFSTYIFTWTNDSERVLPRLYPGINLTQVVHGKHNLSIRYTSFNAIWGVFALSAAYGFIFYYRHQVHA
ncbi:hypothetical protein PENTCL1PPCAC_20172, partial [Pristionchus entomophagus]